MSEQEIITLVDPTSGDFCLQDTFPKEAYLSIERYGNVVNLEIQLCDIFSSTSNVLLSKIRKSSNMTDEEANNYLDLLIQSLDSKKIV